jgi:Transposase
MDVHQATISVAVMDAGGKLIMECLLETKAATIVEFIRGLHGTLSLTFEEGTSAAWLHDLLKLHVSRLVVCDPRKNALLKDGNKSDRIDARKLAELLRGNQLHPVYHGEHWVRTLKELGRSYLTITQCCHQQQRKLTRWTTSRTPSEITKYSGLDLEKQSPSSGRGGAFFLTSLFIELIDLRPACVRLTLLADRRRDASSAAAR